MFFIYHLLQHWQLLHLRHLKDPISTFVKAVLRLLLGFPSTAVDVNLLGEEIAWEGEAGGDLRPVKATVLRVRVMYIPFYLH